MEALLTTVYAKLLELLFRPVEPERVPDGQRGGLMDALNTMLDSRRRARQPQDDRLRRSTSRIS